MFSRQVSRQVRRDAAKAARSDQKILSHNIARRALHSRQTEREKHGLYSGRPVADCISPSRSRVTKRTVKKGQAYGRWLRKIGDYALHATKGWRKA